MLENIHPGLAALPSSRTLPLFARMFAFTKLASVLAVLPALVAGVTVPGADTPLFYLVATGPDSAGVNFLVCPASLVQSGSADTDTSPTRSLCDCMEGVLTTALSSREPGLLGSFSSLKVFWSP